MTICLPTRRTQSIREPSRVHAISSAGDFSRLLLSPIHTDSMTSPATCRCRLRAVVSTSGSSGTSSVYGSQDGIPRCMFQIGANVGFFYDVHMTLDAHSRCGSHTWRRPKNRPAYWPVPQETLRPRENRGRNLQLYFPSRLNQGRIFCTQFRFAIPLLYRLGTSTGPLCANSWQRGSHEPPDARR